MVFCDTCANTQRVALMLRNLGLTAIPLHGQMSQVLTVSDILSSEIYIFGVYVLLHIVST